MLVPVAFSAVCCLLIFAVLQLYLGSLNYFLAQGFLDNARYEVIRGVVSAFDFEHAIFGDHD